MKVSLALGSLLVLAAAVRRQASEATRSMPVAAATVLLLGALAGCLGAGEKDGEATRTETRDDPVTIVPGEDVEPIQGDPLPPPAGHMHDDPAQHEVEVNIDLVLWPAQTAPVGGAELDVQGDWLVQCTNAGVALWNVSKPDAPALTTTLDIGRGCPDAKMTDDANYAVVGGYELWDLRDKDNPVVAATSDETGCHMCAIHEIDGREYLFSAANGPGMSIAEIVREPPEIKKIAEWGFGQSCNPRSGNDPQHWLQNSRAPDPDCLIIGQFHDVYLYDDPLLDKTVAVPAYWDLGVWFVDVSDPANPATLGNWQEYQGESGDIHTTSVDFLEVDGEVRRIAVAASETGPIIGPFSTAEPSSVYVFDATDLDDVQLLARWVNPGKRPSGAQGGEPPIVGEFSTHNVQFEHGRIYLAHYHGGVWVIDVQRWLDEGGAASATTHVVGDDVPTMGVFNVRGMDGEKGRSMVWDVVLNHGFLYASDELFGLFVLHYKGDPQYDPAWTSDA